MRNINNWKKFNESLLVTVAGTILAIKLLKKLYDIYLTNLKVPDEKARETSDELSNRLFTTLKEYIEVSRNGKCDVYQEGNVMSVFVNRKGKMAPLFEINKETRILKTDVGNKIKLSEAEIKDIDNLVFWYKRN